MKKFVDEAQLPGVLTVVARNGKLVHFEAQGFADREKKRPMQADTIFRLYSMSKPMTAVAVMIAYEEGLFGLDDPVARYLPEFEKMKVYAPTGLVDANRPITIRHLLTHTSGLVYAGDENPVAQMHKNAGLTWMEARESGMSTAEAVKKTASLPLLFQPGTQWNYGANMLVLGRLVEVVTGQRYGDFLMKRIFLPLGMVDTDFFVPAAKLDRLAQIYDVDQEQGLVIAGTGRHSSHKYEHFSAASYSKRPLLETGDGGLVSTAPDLVRFFQMLLNDGELDGVRILSPTSVELMRSNQLPPEFGPMPLASLQHPLATRRGLGFGFTMAVVTDVIARGLAGSTGEYSWGGAASTDFWLDPQKQLMGIVLTQVMPSGLYPTRERFQQMTYQAIID